MLPFVLAAISGFTALGYEVIWTRILLPYFGTTTYAFTTMLTTFLIGIALGSALVTRFLRGKRQWLMWIAMAQAILAVSILLTAPGLDLASGRHTEKLIKAGAEWTDVIRNRFLIAGMTMAIPTLAMGVTFPLIIKLALSRFQAAPKQLGYIYAVNTLAAVVGSAVAGFVLVPMLGPSVGMAILCAMNGGVAAYLLIRSSASRRRIWIHVPIATILVIGIPLGVAQTLGGSVHAGVTDLLGSHGRPVFYREGLDANVAVSEDTNGRRWLWVNGDQVATSNWGFTCHQIMGHLPMLLAEGRDRALVIAMGTGITAGAVAMHPTEEVVIVDISEAVLEASRYFAADNHEVYDQEHVKTVLDDGRNYLLTCQDDFDIITAEPLHPWKAGVCNLYSREFYELCLERLSDQYAVCQWIPLYGLSAQDVRILTRAFVDVFPHTTFWVFGVDALLIGTPQRLETTIEELESRMAAPVIKDDLAKMNVHTVWDVLGAFVMDERAVADYVRGDRPLTDDDPVVEYTGPKSTILSSRSADMFREFLNWKTSPRAILSHFTVEQAERLDTLQGAWPFLAKGLIARRLGGYHASIPLFEQAVARCPELEEAKFHLAIALLLKAQTESATLTDTELRDLWTRGLELYPNSLPAMWSMADLEEREGNLDAAMQWWQAYLEKARSRSENAGIARVRMRQIEQALIGTSP